MHTMCFISLTSNTHIYRDRNWMERIIGRQYVVVRAQHDHHMNAAANPLICFFLIKSIWQTLSWKRSISRISKKNKKKNKTAGWLAIFYLFVDHHHSNAIVMTINEKKTPNHPRSICFFSLLNFIMISNNLSCLFAWCCYRLWL